MKSYLRVWDITKDKMVYQTDEELLCVKDNSYWKVKCNFDNVELIETNQNCGEVMYNTNFFAEKYRPIFEYDILRRDWYSFSQDIVFDQQYGLVFYSNGWKIRLENGLELNLTQKEEGKDFRVRTYVSGNVYEGYKDMSTVPFTLKKWDYELPPRLAANISDKIPADFP